MRLRTLTAREWKQYGDLSCHAFGMGPTDINSWIEFCRPHNDAFGVFDGKKLAAALWYYPFQMQVAGKYLPMGGVSAVATWPEYRNVSLAKQLMTAAQAHMRNEGCALSVLLPFKFSFYERMGYAQAFDVLVCTFDPRQLRRLPDEGFAVKRLTDIRRWRQLNTVQQAFGARYNGTVKRDMAYWKRRVFRDPRRVVHPYLITRHGKPQGYVFCSFKSLRPIENAEMSAVYSAWTNPAAARAVFRVLQFHRDQFTKIKMFLPPDVRIHHFFEDPRVELQIKPKMMFKVVDIVGAVRQRSFPRGLNVDLIMGIEGDDTAPWNDRAFRLTIRRGRGKATPLSHGRRVRPQITTTIQAFSQLYLGYYSAQELKGSGTLTGAEKHIASLTKAFPPAPVYIEDWF